MSAILPSTHPHSPRPQLQLAQARKHIDATIEARLPGHRARAWQEASEEERAHAAAILAALWATLQGLGFTKDDMTVVGCNLDGRSLDLALLRTAQRRREAEIERHRP